MQLSDVRNSCCYESMTLIGLVALSLSDQKPRKGDACATFLSHPSCCTWYDITWKEIAARSLPRMMVKIAVAFSCQNPHVTQAVHSLLEPLTKSWSVSG